MQECSACREDVTTAVCPHCLEQEAIAWVQDYFPNKPELRFNIMDITDDLVMGSTPINNPCILCKGAISICRDCFVEEVALFLKKHYSLLVPGFLNTFSSKSTVERVIVEVKPMPKLRMVT